MTKFEASTSAPKPSLLREMGPEAYTLLASLSGEWGANQSTKTGNSNACPRYDRVLCNLRDLSSRVRWERPRPMLPSLKPTLADVFNGVFYIWRPIQAARWVTFQSQVCAWSLRLVTFTRRERRTAGTPPARQPMPRTCRNPFRNCTPGILP